MAGLAAFAPARAAELTIDAPSNFVVEARINGQPARLRVDPSAPGYIILNPEAAARLGLRPSMTGTRTRIGPVLLNGWSRVAQVSIGGVTADRRVLWIERPAVADADGRIGPADMPYDRVTFRLGAPGPGERTYDLPMTFERGYGLFFPMIVGAETVRVQFTLARGGSMATAGAGAQIALLHDGGWTGPARQQAIAYQVERPVRPLRLERPVSVNGFEIAEFLVRTGDNRGDLALPPEPDADPLEIVVTGTGRQRPAFNLTIGRDRLASCSSLVWDNGARRLSLVCAPIGDESPH